MKIDIKREPCMLYETVELLYAYLNHIPPERLTVVGSYCIPAPQMGELMEKACKGVSTKDQDLLRYFKTQTIQGEHEVSTCLAFCMTYCFMVVGTTDMDQQRKEMCESWERTRQNGFVIRGIGRCSLDLSVQPEKAAPSLAHELQKLPIAQDFFLDLLECFSGFSYHMERLFDCIQPVARTLRELLEPYIQKAEPLRQAWHSFFEEHTVEEFVQKRMGITPEKPFSEVDVVLRYLDCSHAIGEIDTVRNSLGMHSGVGVQPTLKPAYEQGRLTEQEFAAFRLLGNKGRSQMIQTLVHRSMAMQELATEMELNPGLVFRDLNSLANAGLLRREVRDGRCYYRTNLPYLDAIFQHVLAFYQDTSPILPE